MAKEITAWEIDEKKDRIVILEENIADDDKNTEKVQIKYVTHGAGKVYKLIIKKKDDDTLLHEYTLRGKIPPDVG